MNGNTFSLPRAAVPAVERRRARHAIALGAHLRHALALRSLGVLADFENRDAELRLVGDELVDANDHATMLLDLPLLARRRLGDLALEPAGLESARRRRRRSSISSNSASASRSSWSVSASM